jgi:signal peptidase
MTTATRVLRYLIQVFIAAVAVAAAALIILPKAMGWQGVLVLTGSMEPALQAGGVAFVDRVQPEQVRVGDIITFTRPDSTQQVTHRVIEVVATSDGARFRTKGDANDIPDDWIVRRSQLVGKVRLALPKLGGFVRLFVGNRQQLGLFMALPATYLVFDEVRRWRDGRRRKPQARTWADTVAMALVADVRGRRARETRTS